jgi:hypothetical protein
MIVVTASAATPAVDTLLATWKAQGATPDATRGAALWKQGFPAADGGPARACTTCHGPTLDAAGKHASTGEPIAPMTAPDRLTDAAKIEKWFGRNCRWTLGRECTVQERADVLLFLAGGAR